MTFTIFTNQALGTTQMTKVDWMFHSCSNQIIAACYELTVLVSAWWSPVAISVSQLENRADALVA